MKAKSMYGLLLAMVLVLASFVEGAVLFQDDFETYYPGNGGKSPQWYDAFAQPNGMVVESDVPEVNKVRRVVAEMLIADHPADCLVCSSNQSCGLQEIARYLGVDGKRLASSAREIVPDESNPFFVRDLAKCVLCGRCVRTCQELRGVGAIDLAFRGHDARVATSGSGLIMESSCDSCGL